MNADPSNNDNEQAQRLCPRSREAVDALVGSGFDVEPLAPEHRERCSGITSLLAKLKQGSVPCCCADESVKRTMERIAAAESSRSMRYDLCDADADALELLVAHNWDARKVPSAMRQRAERQAQLLSLLDDAIPASAASISTDHLVRAAIGRIEAESAGQARRMKIHEPAAPQRRGFRITDIGAVAALLLVAVSVAWPALSSVRQRAQQSACIGNFGAIAQAVAQYGSENNSSLPMATASRAGNTWWNVGQPQQSNSANLFKLAKAGFAKPQQLACCANAASKDCRFTDDCEDWRNYEQVSYSYQNLFAKERPRLDAPGERFIVLADRNPAVLRALRGERVIYINENSPNHRGQGQNVLYSDGHAEWAVTPIINGDNIWLPRSIEDLIARMSKGRNLSQTEPLKGVEEPAKADVFLCP
jgi:type II secretory pathway pseudopilin PulG